MKDAILKRYYYPRRRKDETIEQTISRVDNEIIEQRFKYLSSRDIFTLEEVDAHARLD